MGCSVSFGNKAIWEDIKRYDSALELVWNNEVNRWEVWRNSQSGRKMFITRMENSDGSYRPIDRRLLSYLVNNDGWKKSKVDDLAREMNDYDEQERNKRRSRWEEKCDYIEKDTRRYAEGEKIFTVPCNIGNRR